MRADTTIKTTPYEVRGGFAIHVSQLWSFVQDMQRLEVESFGCQLPLSHSGRNPQQTPRQLKIDVALLQGTGDVVASRHPN